MNSLVTNVLPVPPGAPKGILREEYVERGLKREIERMGFVGEREVGV